MSTPASARFPLATPQRLPSTAAVESSLVSTLRMLLPVLLIALPLAYGAYRVFPIYDDGWLMLLIREQGLGIVRDTMPDRPLYAVTLAALLVEGGYQTAIAVGTTVALWVALAFIAHLLWRRLQPPLAHYSPVVACLVIAPVVSTCQLTTVVTSLQILPVLAVYGALLVLLRFSEVGGGFRLPFAAVAIFAGVVFSEYAIPATACSLALLARPVLFPASPLQRRRALQSMVVLGFACVIGYGVFLAFSDVSFRPSVDPTTAGIAIRKNPFGTVLKVVNGTWHALVGSYGDAIGRIEIHMDSKSTIISTLFAILTAIVLVFTCRKPARLFREATPASSDYLFPAAAVFLGLLPVALMGRNTVMEGFGSRFVIPILPVAAVATLAIALRLGSQRWRWVLVGLLGLCCANAAAVAQFSALRERALIDAVGQALKPMVSNDGMTVAVINRPGIDYEFTATATLDWPVNASKRFWLFDMAEGEKVLGSRQACLQPLTINEEQRYVSRSGPIERAIWIETRGFKITSIEPYCRPK